MKIVVLLVILYIPYKVFQTMELPSSPFSQVHNKDRPQSAVWGLLQKEKSTSLWSKLQTKDNLSQKEGKLKSENLSIFFFSKHICIY